MSKIIRHKNIFSDINIDIKSIKLFYLRRI